MTAPLTTAEFAERMTVRVASDGEPFDEDAAMDALAALLIDANDRAKERKNPASGDAQPGVIDPLRRFGKESLK